MNSAMSAGYSDTRTRPRILVESWADVGHVPRTHARMEKLPPRHAGTSLDLLTLL
jgi:hypothetical protein